MASNNPVIAARETLNCLGWTKPGDLELEEMVFALGANLKETKLEGSEGRIIMDKSSAIISVDSSIRIPGKRNFVIAHEIGHFRLHRFNSKLFSDTDKTLSDWHNKEAVENEANIFATEFLMPTHLFHEKINHKRLSLDLIIKTAEYFRVSYTACALRYIRLGDYPSMVVYSENSTIRWKQCSDDFPFQFLRLYEKVPVYTVAGDFFVGNGIEEKPVKVDVIQWFPEDFEAQQKSDWQIYEQCFQVADNGVISVLWTF